MVRYDKLAINDSFMYHRIMEWLTAVLKRTPLFVTDTDLAVIEPNPAARHGKVKRALARGDLIRIRRGLYCLSEAYRKEPIDSFVLANKIYAPSFISFESALSFYGLIPEAVYSTTSLSLRRSVTMDTPVGSFTFQFSRAFNMEGVNREKSPHCNDHFLVASPVRAIFDYVHVHRLKWGSIEPLIQSLRIEEEHLRGLDVSRARDLAKLYRNPFIERLAGEMVKYA